MKKLIRVTIVNTGGAFSAGFIDDADLANQIKTAIAKDSLNCSMELDNGEYFETYNHANILDIKAPSISGASIIIEESNDVDEQYDFERKYKYVSELGIDESPVNTFTSSIPEASHKITDYADDTLIFYSRKVEKRIHYPAPIERHDGDEFELANVYLGSMNMEKTISPDQILQDFLYIPKAEAADYCKEFLGDRYDDNCALSDHMSAIYIEAPDLGKKIREKHLVYPGDIEGKGEWDSEYIRITTLEDEDLFEDGV
ncbi:hypothetical protein [Wenzhouxiangella limi]|uniref:Uncharacterized protein n=1 Tax=Wenzhouxiangella limi TaxID=2707351 RepID=A0A845UUA1_9GAMM|nr:hypothetical protein [Wenzhouxiangella limi]NDY94124.1 hypothetical protein [Wenzhouxiangella limi]